MNTTRSIVTLALLAAFAGGAHAQSEKTRAQVKQELAEAIRSGDIQAPGDVGMKLNELYPERYARAQPSSLTRAQVKAELADATRSGDVVAVGESGLKVNELFPQRFPAPVVTAAAKTRAEVKLELAEAIRNGEMVPAGEGGPRPSEGFVPRYAKAKARSQSAGV